MDRLDDREVNINEAFNNENAGIRQFFLNCQTGLLNHPISKLPLCTQRNIAVKLRSRSLFPENDWKKEVYIMGIQDEVQIAAIEAAAECRREMPMFIALNQYLADRSFAHLIDALLRLERYDILRSLMEYTQRLIEETNLNSHVKGREASLSKISNCNKSNSYSCTQNPTLHIKEDSLPLSSKRLVIVVIIVVIIYIVILVVTIPDSTVVFESLLEQNLSSENYTVPPAPMQENLTEEKISVFILHTGSDTHYARQLCEKLRKAEFKVKTMSDMEVVLATNDIEALRATFEEAFQLYKRSFRNGINREDLLNCNDADDENEQLKQFYERNLQYLKKYPEKTVLADIARMIHKTLLGKVYWRRYAVILGFTDSELLDKIEVSAEKNKEQELYTFFTRVLPKTKGFDHIIRMLLIEECFDVLRKIHHDAERLIEKNLNTQVKTMSDMQVVLAMKDIEALRAIFEEVDFIVPIVSDSLFKVIHTPHLNQLVESTDAVNNKIFYQWIMNEYQCNSCINYRVWPVILPGMYRQKLIKDIIFKFSFRLGVEDDELIRILRETKDRIPQYRLQVNCE